MKRAGNGKLRRTEAHAGERIGGGLRGGALASDHGLGGVVVVDRQHVAGRFAADARDGFLIAAHDGEHAARIAVSRTLHGRAARRNHLKAVLKRESAGCGERRVLAKRVACDSFRLAQFGHDGVGRHGNSVNSRLRDLGLCQRGCVALEGELGDVKAQDVVGAFINIARGLEVLKKLATHAGILGTLAAENESKFVHLK